MDISMRSILTAGVTAITATAIVVAPSVAPLPAPHVAVSRTVQLAAAVQTLSSHVVTSAAAAADPAPVPLGTPAEVFDAAYDALIYWSGLGVQGLTWALSIVPYGNLLVDQVYAFYSPTVYFTNSLVDNLIEPVLADPTNPAVWANGIVQSAYTGLNSLLNLGINEVNLVINYAINLIPAIPLSLAAPASVTTFDAAAAVTSPQPASIQELVKSALAPVERLVNTTVATLQNDLAATEATITGAVPAKDTPAADDVAAASTEPTAAATKVTHSRFQDAVTESVAPAKVQPSGVAGKAQSHPQTATVGPAKATAGAAKTGTQPRKSGHAAHSGKSAR
jgi:hypothetical protein